MCIPVANCKHNKRPEISSPILNHGIVEDDVAVPSLDLDFLVGGEQGRSVDLRFLEVDVSSGSLGCSV